MKEQKLRFLRRTRIIIPFLVIAILCAGAFSNDVKGIDQSSMTVILIRHAEKRIVPPENKDPELSPAGLSRAQELVNMFGDSGTGRFTPRSTNVHSKL